MHRQSITWVTGSAYCGVEVSRYPWRTLCRHGRGVSLVPRFHGDPIWEVDRIHAMMHFCHDREVCPDVLAEPHLVHEEHHGSHAIHERCSVMKSENHSKLFVEDLRTGTRELLPQQTP